MIAAIAVIHGLTLATQNTKDFEQPDFGLLNSWV